MALQIWLPLRGNLENNGLLGDAQISCVSPNIQDNGKIGKCYSCTTNNNRIEIKHNNLKTIFKKGNSYSIALWVYINSMSDGVHAIFGNYNNSSFFNIQFNGALNSENNPSGWISVLCGTPTDYITEKGFIRTQGVWTHIAITYDGDKTIAFYKNGEQQSIKTNIDYKLISDSVDTFFIGGDKTGRVLNGQINDFRIYDHCLSNKEVEEISKGLIMHYMLNLPQQNLLQNPTTVQESGYYMGYEIPFINFEPNTKYTLQLWDINVSHSAVESASQGIKIYMCYTKAGDTSSTNTNMKNLIGSSYFSINGTSAHADYLDIKITSPNVTLENGTLPAIRIYNSSSASGTKKIKIKNWKLEKGEIATPFEEDIIYDCSGYRNNGIAHNVTGVFPSPKYNTATNFNGTGYISNISDIIEQNSLNSEFTFCAWVKRNYTTENTKYIYNGIVSIYLSTGFKPSFQWNMQNADGSYSQVNGWGPGTGNGVIPKDIWTHFVFTFRRGVLSFYYNGILIGSVDRSANGIYIKGYQNKNLGATSNSSNTFSNYFIGDISDVRVYMTALSENQIKDLYNTSMAIDSNGNVYARELIE